MLDVTYVNYLTLPGDIMDVLTVRSSQIMAVIQVVVIALLAIHSVVF